METRNAVTASVHELVANRWSPRGFDASHELSDAELASILEAARWTPSASNTQPWAFIVGRRGGEVFDKIFATLGGFNRDWADAVSALIVAVAEVEKADGTAMPSPLYDLGQTAAWMTVQAESMGLNVHQMLGFDADAVAAAFEVPSGLRPYTVIAIGKHSDDVDASIRERDAAPRGRAELRVLAQD